MKESISSIDENSYAAARYKYLKLLTTGGNYE